MHNRGWWSRGVASLHAAWLRLGGAGRCRVCRLGGCGRRARLGKVDVRQLGHGLDLLDRVAQDALPLVAAHLVRLRVRLQQAAHRHRGGRGAAAALELAHLPLGRGGDGLGRGGVGDVVHVAVHAARVVALHHDVPLAVHHLRRVDAVGLHLVKRLVGVVPAQVRLAALAPRVVLQAQVPLGVVHEHARRDGGVAREVGAHVDHDGRCVGVEPAVGAAAEAAPRGELPGPLAVAVAAHGVLPDGQQHLGAQVVEHLVLVLERHGGGAVVGHERLLQRLHHVARLVRAGLQVQHYHVGSHKQGVPCHVAVLAGHLHSGRHFLLHRLGDFLV
mmetsp:Transcript_8422/g.21021  ORF Transcript_8422/g.21021 Transcript_8422/m.21021 type:complete len:330 (-) Transcript_8422:331-1320(-)